MSPQNPLERAVAGKKKSAARFYPLSQAPLINSYQTCMTPIWGEGSWNEERIFLPFSPPQANPSLSKPGGQLTPGNSCVSANSAPLRAGRGSGSPLFAAELSCAGAVRAELRSWPARQRLLLARVAEAGALFDAELWGWTRLSLPESAVFGARHSTRIHEMSQPSRGVG